MCVYCARNFCGRHGDHPEELYEVCHRDRCQAKYNDLQEHARWVRRQHGENVIGRCADEDCDSTPEIPCERCALHFCQRHVRPVGVREGNLDRMVAVSRMLCHHCRERRALWD